MIVVASKNGDVGIRQLLADIRFQMITHGMGLFDGSALGHNHVKIDQVPTA